jgi:hypothetical protein
MVKFLLDNKTPILLAAGWIFSAGCSSMPPLPDKAGYLLTWAHNFLQAVAGNINKIRG